MTQTSPANQSPPSTTSRTLAWAIYLAMSWTWCIGMFLPVILMRELGITGVITFAIPNIVGAAAMGWIIRDAEQSRRIVADHRTALVWFSLVTILYHGYFAAWMIRQIAGPGAGIGIAAGFLIFWLLLHWRQEGNFAAAVLALAVTAAAMIWGFSRGILPYLAQPVEGARLAPLDNLLLAPAWLLGFFCCPWMDLTFHAARQALDKSQARLAFTLGFGLFFAAMLALTVCYSGWLVTGFDRAQNPELALILSAHLIVQSCLTAALHTRQIAEVQPRFKVGQFLIFSLALIVLVWFGTWTRDGITYNGITLGEIVYRILLGFYGLVFPAYVWLAMVPPRKSLLRVVAVIIIAAPLYWLAFGDEQMIYIVPGALVVFLAKFLPGTV